MSIEDQTSAMTLLSSLYGYDLDFQMNTECDYKIIVTNIVGISDNEIKELKDAGFHTSIYTNLGETNDGYGFNINIYPIKK